MTRSGALVPMSGLGKNRLFRRETVGASPRLRGRIEAQLDTADAESLLGSFRRLLRGVCDGELLLDGQMKVAEERNGASIHSCFVKYFVDGVSIVGACHVAAALWVVVAWALATCALAIPLFLFPSLSFSLSLSFSVETCVFCCLKCWSCGHTTP